MIIMMRFTTEKKRRNRNKHELAELVFVLNFGISYRLLFVWFVFYRELVYLTKHCPWMLLSIFSAVQKNLVRERSSLAFLRQ
jgi:hypothetical protein